MDQIMVDGAAVRLFQIGRESDAPDIVYIHSASGEVCAIPFFQRLADAGYRVRVPELPGSGATASPVKRWRHIEDAVFHLRRTLEALSDRRVILIGSSLGGWLAAELAVWAGERIAALVLIDAVGLRVEGRPIYNIFGVPGIGDHQAEMQARANPHKVDIASIIAPAIADKKVSPSDAMLLHFLKGQTVAARLGWNPYMHDSRLADRLAGVRSPALILWGGDDRLVPVEHGEEYARRLLDARLEILAETGHLPALERPDEVADLIVSFLGEHSLAPRAAADASSCAG